MNALQAVDLPDVGAYWKTRGLVPDRYLPYYVRWLQRFLAGPGGDSRLAPGDAERAFVEPLARQQVPEWQVRPAARAVELHVKHCLRFRREQTADLSGAVQPAQRSERPATLAVALDEARRLIRMCPYAYRTEQTEGASRGREGGARAGACRGTWRRRTALCAAGQVPEGGLGVVMAPWPRLAPIVVRTRRP